MAILSFVSGADVPDLPAIPGDNSAQAVLAVIGTYDVNWFRVPVEPLQDKLGDWDRMVKVVAAGGLQEFDVTMAQNHIIGALFLGYRELTKADDGRAELYSVFTKKLRDICASLQKTDDAEPRLREVVEWLHDVLSEEVFLAIPGYWKGDGPTALAGNPGQSTPDWIRNAPIEGDALTWTLRMAKAARILPTLDGGDHLADQFTNMQANLLGRGFSHEHHPIEDMRTMLAWVQSRVPEEVYARIMNA